MLPGDTSSPARTVWLALGLGAGLLALVLLFRLDPARHGFFPRCLLHQFTGLQCPGCGGQRSLHHLLHGELATAFRCNALFVTLLPIGVWHLVRRALRPWRGYELPALFRHHAWLWVSAVATIVFAIVRNLPAFDWLRP